MPLRKSFIVSLACLGCLATAPQASADPITLYTNYSSNYVSARANDDSAGDSTNYTYVNSLPATVSATYATGTSSSSTTGNLTTSMLSFGFNQSLVDPNSFANGVGVIYFTAGVDTTYTISGSLTATGGFTSEQLYADLLDMNTETDIYFYHTVSSSSTQTFDSSGGPLTGLLTAGDVYFFQAQDNLYGASGASAGLTGNTTITFSQPSVVPEPSSWIMLGLGSSLPFYIRSRRRRTPA